MNERPLDQTGSTQPGEVDDSGRAGLDDPGRGQDPGTGLGRPHGFEGGHRPNDGSGPDEAVDETEREAITSGAAATSEMGDPDAQSDAERRPGGPPNAGTAAPDTRRSGADPVADEPAAGRSAAAIAHRPTRPRLHR